MSIKKIIYDIIALVAIIIGFTGCTERIEIDTNDADPIVSIYSEISNHNVRQKVEIKMTAPFFSNEPNKPLDNAAVSITSSDNESWTLLQDTDGLYYTENPQQGKPGVTYSLQVVCDYNNDGIEDVFTAETTMRDLIVMDSVAYIPIRMHSAMFYSVSIWTTPSKKDQYALYRFYRNGESISEMLEKVSVADIQMWNDTEYLDGLMCHMLVSEDEIDQIDEEQRYKKQFVAAGDVVSIEMGMIEKDYYKFITQCQSIINGENPMFGGPASNAITNIKGGAIGFFGSHSKSTVSNIVPEWKLN